MLRWCSSGVRRLQWQVMTSIGRSDTARRPRVGLSALMVAWGAVAACVSALVVDTAATNAVSSGEASASPVAPNGPSCIIGLNCGCVHNCGPAPQHHPAPATDHPPDGTPAPRAGPGGG